MINLKAVAKDGPKGILVGKKPPKMKNLPYFSSLGRVAIIISITLAIHQSRADLIYYMPFDDGSNASLANLWKCRRQRLCLRRHAEHLHLDTDRAGQRVLGNDERRSQALATFRTSAFRLSTTGQQMTFSTWTYIDSSTYNWIDFFGNASSATGDASSGGWYLSIVGNAGTTRIEWPGMGNTRTTSSVPLGGWYNLVLSYTVDGKFNFYLNGTNMGHENSFDYGVPAMSNASPLVLSAGVDTASYDDLAMWNTALSEAKIRALSSAPAALAIYDAYNAGTMNTLYSLYDTGSGSATIDSLTWTNVSGFDTTGHSAGDTWVDGTSAYIWLGGDANAATGLISTVPEPSVLALSFWAQPSSSFVFGKNSFLRQYWNPIKYGSPEHSLHIDQPGFLLCWRRLWRFQPSYRSRLALHRSLGNPPDTRQISQKHTGRYGEKINLPCIVTAPASRSSAFAGTRGNSIKNSIAGSNRSHGLASRMHLRCCNTSPIGLERC